MKLNHLLDGKDTAKRLRSAHRFVFLQHMEATVPKAKYDELVANYNVLKHELETLKRLIFASKSERHVPTADEQMSLWNQEEKTGQTEAEKQTVTYQRGKQKKACRLPLSRYRFIVEFLMVIFILFWGDLAQVYVWS